MNENASLSGGLWPSVDHLIAPSALAEIAVAALEADREGRLSERGLEVLRRVGWPGLPVPRKFGGLGASLLESCAVQRKLAAADSGLAIAGTMHLGSVGVWVEHYNLKQDMTWVFMEAVASRSLIVASAIAEPTLGGSVTRSTLRAKRVEGGWEVSGSKSPLSFAAHADLIALQMQSEETADAPSEVLVALIPRSAKGISSKLTWDTLGMRGSGSDTLVLDRCVIPDPLIVYRGAPGYAEGDSMIAGVAYFCIVITASYLGMAEAALNSTRELLTQMRVAHLDSTRAALPTFQGILGQQVTRLLTLEAACSGLAAKMDAGADRRALLAPALALKQHAVEVIPDLIGRLAELCGGASYSKKNALERHWRDAQAIRFHPPTPVQTNQYLGRRGLGVAAALDIDEASPRLQAAMKAAAG